MPSDRTWIVELRAGNRGAAQPLYDRYMERLVRLTREHLQGIPRRAADEEDVALSVFKSAYLRIERGEFEWLQDGGDLWRVLLCLAACKAAELAKHERAKRRDHRMTVEGLDKDAASILAREPTAEFAAQYAEEVQRRLASLADPVLRRIAIMRMDGFKIAEIARELGVVRSTVDRKLEAIRGLWIAQPEPNL